MDTRASIRSLSVIAILLVLLFSWATLTLDGAVLDISV